MAFEFELEDDFEGPLIEDDGTWLIDIALGYDTEDDLAVVMSVMLVPGDAYLEGQASNVFDLQFGIRRKWPDRTSAPDFDKQAGRQFIPPERNAEVLMAIRRAVMWLVDAVRPTDLTMETYHADLDPKALKKYELICAGLVEVGYEVADAFREPSNGINYWYLRRRPE